jgi:mono/diheme cytochrome c family protein
MIVSMPMIWVSLLCFFAFFKSDLPPGEGKAIVERACIGCHALKVVSSKRATKKEWASVVDQMISRGAEVDDDEVETLIKYLSKNFPAADKNSSPSADQKANSK